MFSGKPTPGVSVTKVDSGNLTPRTNLTTTKHDQHLDTLIINNNYDNRPFTKIQISGIDLLGLLDSGANRTAINQITYNKLRQRTIFNEVPMLKTVMTACNEEILVTSCIELPLSYNSMTKNLLVLVVPKLSRDIILGMDFWTEFNIVPTIQLNTLTDDLNKQTHNLSSLQTKQLIDIQKKFLLTENGQIGRTEVLCHVIDTGNAKPFRQRPYPVSPYKAKRMDVELDRMLKMGVIVPSTSEWSSPIVAVEKKNGTLRTCLDSRKLNEVTIKEAYPLPYITRILGRLQSSKFLTSIDLSDAFWQVPLHPDSQPKTAFRVPGRGLFMYATMPMGLCNSAQTMSRLMDIVLGCDLEPSVFYYLDDIIICTDTFEEHMRITEIVANRLRDAKLTINLGKSKFCCKELKYLGYLLTTKGLSTDPEKVQVIEKYPPPTSVTEVRRFLGMTGWYQRFIRKYSDIAASLTELTKKQPGKFKMTPEGLESFEKLKHALTIAPVLVNPRFDLPFTIQCDASNIAVGGVLTQQWDDGEHVVAYAAQKLNKCQTKYMACEKELLAVLVCIEKFRGYVEGAKFFVLTDNSAVAWLRNFKDPTGRLARWALKLQKYNFSISHRPGKTNKVADAISRVPDCCEINVLKIDSGNWYTELKEKARLGKDDKYQFIQGNLYRSFIKRNGKDVPIKQLKFVVPINDQLLVLKESHDSPLAAHQGFFKTLKRIREKYYWPGMANDVKNFVKACDRCKATKHTNKRMTAPMGKPKNYDRPWQMIYIDFSGPYPRSKRGNTVLLVITDWLTKYSILKPMRDMKAAALTRYLEEEVFLVYGVPQVVLTDNATNFVSKKFRALLKQYNIKEFLNARYFPQNNPTERVNRSIGAAVRAYMEEDHREWDTNLAKIACAFRTSTHESTQFSPYYLNFGRNMITNGKDYKIPNLTDFSEEVVKTRTDPLEKARKIAKENLLKAHERSSRHYNLRTRPIEFKVGEIVWKRNFKQSDASNKFCAKLSDPFLKCKIKSKAGTNTYVLEDLDGKELGLFHTNAIKPN